MEECIYDRNKPFEFDDEKDVEEFVRNILYDFKFNHYNNQKDFEDSTILYDSIKECVEYLCFSLIYYILAVQDEKNLNEVLKLIDFSINTINDTGDECVYTKYMENLDTIAPGHPSVLYYEQLKKITLNELLNVFEILSQILREKSK